MRVHLFIATLVIFSMVPSLIGGTFEFVHDASATPSPTPQENSGKRNERPAPSPRKEEVPIKEDGSRFKYVFSQPDFIYSRMIIEHDASGKGTFSFDKKGNAETVVEDIEVSKKVLNRLNFNFDALKFLESDESYQHRRDFSHLGNVEITYSRDGKYRTVNFNWTENPHARALMDDYRRLSQQFTWVFELRLARDTQPLETPKMMATLDSLITRNEIADPDQLLSFLEELSNDERLPLIARNRARSIIQAIRKK